MMRSENVLEVRWFFVLDLFLFENFFSLFVYVQLNVKFLLKRNISIKKVCVIFDVFSFVICCCCCCFMYKYANVMKSTKLAEDFWLILTHNVQTLFVLRI